jgi:hypothetical protein
LINSRQTKRILRAVFVEVSVVDAHPPRVCVFLADEDRVGKPLKMENFADEARRE